MGCNLHSTSGHYGHTCSGNTNPASLSTCCNSNRCKPQGTSKPPRTNTSWNVLNIGDKLKATIISQMTTALNAELSIRSMSSTSWTTVTVGNKFRKILLSELITVIDSCDTKDNRTKYSWSSISIGDKIKKSIIDSIRSRIHTLQSYCICNCNYCTCDCNYCTCDCNHTCTCNCNYSDFNLKTDIVYL